MIVYSMSIFCGTNLATALSATSGRSRSSFSMIVLSGIAFMRSPSSVV